MAILAECPICHKKQATKNRLCKCGEDLVKAKRSKKVRYWIDFQPPGGKPRREPVGFSIEEARAADGKRKGQKKENRIFEMLPEANMTFNQLAEWYLSLKSVKSLTTYDRVQGCLANFNNVFGHHVVNTIRPVDLENYQHERLEEGRAPATVDMELSITKTMITKAFDNDKVGGRTVKAFRKYKKLLKKGSNARETTITIEQYVKLRQARKPHLKAVVIVGMNTGMRKGELLGLRWSHIDRKKGFIRLPAELTKENKPKSIPINHHVLEVLDALPRSLHHDYVFTYRGKPIKKLRRSFETACRDAGIPYGRKVEDGITFHDIRATFDTNMDRAGVSESRRKVILGHSLEGMDRHYLRLNDEDLKAAMDQYTAWMDDQIANLDQTLDQTGNEG